MSHRSHTYVFLWQRTGCWAFVSRVMRYFNYIDKKSLRYVIAVKLHCNQNVNSQLVGLIYKVVCYGHRITKLHLSRLLTFGLFEGFCSTGSPENRQRTYRKLLPELVNIGFKFQTPYSSNVCIRN